MGERKVGIDGQDGMSRTPQDTRKIQYGRD